MRDTGLKPELVFFVFVALLICSTFSSAFGANTVANAESSSGTLPNQGNTGYEPWYYYIVDKVSSVNGNLYISERDNSIKVNGFDIEIIRSYNSHNSEVNSPFGFGWTFNYNLYLVENPDGSVTFYDGDGSIHTFTKSEVNNYTAPPGIHSKLTKKPNGSFILRFKDGSSFNFDANGTLLNITDKNGNKLSFTYTKEKLTRISDDSGLYLSFDYRKNRISTIKDPLRTRRIKYEYDEEGNLAKVTDGMRKSNLYSYYDDHKIESFTDKIGNKEVLSYYDDGRVESIKIGVPYVCLTLCSFVYEDQNNVVLVTDAMGYNMSIKVNNAGNPMEIIDPSGYTTRMVWDSDMKIVNFSDANGHTYTCEYDRKGNLIKETDLLGYVTTYGWINIDSNASYISLLSDVTDARRFTTSFEYDADGNLIKTTDTSGNSSYTTYNGSGYVTSITDVRGATILLSYNKHGYLTKITDATGNVTEFEYDAVGRLVKITDANGHSTQFEYNKNDRVTTIKDALGHKTRYNYNEVGTLISTIDANKRETGYSNNIIGRVGGITDATGNKISYFYDKNGNLIKITNANNGNTAVVYDALGRVISVTDPIGNTENYTYDAVGNLITLKDANGNTLSYTYDALNRPIRLEDDTGYTATYSYDALGNVLFVQESDGYSTSYKYDELNRVMSATIDYDSFSKAISYTYDENGNRLTMTEPEGGITTYDYDAANHLIKIIDPSGDVTTFAYDNAGRRTRVIYPNDVITEYTYDAADRLVNIVNKNSSGNVISSYTYTYDKVGNMLSITEANGDTTRYEYDALYRLTKVTYPSREVIGYIYDALGNRLSKIDTIPISYTYDVDNRLLTAGTTNYSYDNNGNLIAKLDGTETTSYGYDSMNRLTKVILPNGEEISYKYAPTGERLSRTDSNVTKYYLYDFEDVLMELDESGTQLARYTHGPRIDEPISMLRNGAKSYYLFDCLGSVTSLVDVNEDVKSSYKYDAFGEILEESGGVINPFRFTSREYDEGTGLYYYRARYYDPEVGRFLSKDPTWDRRDPQSLNLYTYVKNNPVNSLDPSGGVVVVSAMGIAMAISGVIGAVKEGYTAYNQYEGHADRWMYTTAGALRGFGAHALGAGAKIPRTSEFINQATKVASGEAKFKNWADVMGIGKEVAKNAACEWVGGKIFKQIKMPFYKFIRPHVQGRWSLLRIDIDGKLLHMTMDELSKFIFDSFSDRVEQQKKRGPSIRSIEGVVLPGSPIPPDSEYDYPDDDIEPPGSPIPPGPEPTPRPTRPPPGWGEIPPILQSI